MRYVRNTIYMNISNVLSCFDGISCAQLALQRAGISYMNYYASEIDKFAISVTQTHFPQTIQVGNIKELKPDNFSNIDLMIGGFPCQSFSIAGNKLGFKDNRGKLFFDMYYLFNALKPKYFIFENVKMRSDIRDAISTLLGVEAIEINSNKFTAQNRKRLYWTNIPVRKYYDEGILLADILESDIAMQEKANTVDANYWKGGSEKNFKLKRNLKLPTSQSERRYQVLTEARTESAKAQRRENLKNGIDYCSRADKVYVPRTDHKSNTITTSGDENILLGENDKLRLLTPMECERLQGIPDNYTAILSDTQRYKSIGNGFTVPVIAHILRGINETPSAL